MTRIEESVPKSEKRETAEQGKLQNLKETVKTINFLTANNLLQYAALEGKTAEAAAALDTAADSLKAADKRLADMAALIKRVTNYQQTKPVVDGIKTAKDKTAYRRAHESAFILHEAAAKALRKQAGDGGKLPSPAALQAEYAKLTDKKNALRAEYGKLKRQAKEYGIVKKNVDSILNPGTEQQQTQARRRERGAEL